MIRCSIALLVLLGFSVPGAVAGKPPADRSRPRLDVPRDAKTFVWVRKRVVGYVQRSPDNGPGIWVGFNPAQLITRDGNVMTSYCRVGDELSKWGAAARASGARWLIRTIVPTRRVGSVRPVSRNLWAILRLRARLAARARGPDGPAAAMAFLTLRGCSLR
jgi:hypothetical protein